MPNYRLLTRPVAVGLMVVAVAGLALFTGGLASAALLPGARTTVLAQDANSATTTIALQVSSSVPAGTTSPVLTATITPPTAAGTVEFLGDSFILGNPIPVTDGTASAAIPLLPGEHFLIADFTPTDPAYSGSMSNTVSYTVDDPGLPAAGATPTITLATISGL
jgi:hypothetical protein